MFSPDGQWIASAGHDSTAKLWNSATGKLQVELRGHTHKVNYAAFNHDGSRLATTDATSVRIWDVPGGRELLRLGKDVSGGLAVVFSHDGTRLAAVSYPGTVRIWDARPLSPQTRLEREALGLVEFFRQKLGVTPDVEQAIRASSTVSEPARRRALALLGNFRDQPGELNSKSWEIVRKPNLSREEYLRALRWSERVVELLPDWAASLNTLGVAQYRVGQYKQAIQTLSRSAQIGGAQPGGPYPSDLAFLAIAQYRSGDKRQAEKTLLRLREKMKEVKWSKDRDSRNAAAEVEAVIGLSR